MKHLSKLMMGLILLLSFTACDKNESPEVQDLTATEVTTSRVTAYGDDWIYFSFETGKEVTVDESKHSTELTWDIAFNRYNMRTNSGKSGKGKGGAYDAGKVAFSSVITAPESGYTVDEEYSITDVGSGFPPPTKLSSGNTVLAGAIVFTGPPPVYSASEHVYVLKTADGKYAKILFSSFYDTKGASGIITFKYVYQPDGSTNLK